MVGRGDILAGFLFGRFGVGRSNLGGSGLGRRQGLAVVVGRGFAFRFLVGAEGGPFAVAMGADRQQLGGGVGHDHAHDAVLADEADSLDAARIAAHRPGVGLGEADRHPVGGGEHDFVSRLGDCHVDQFVALAELDGDDAVLHRAAVSLQLGLLHQAAGSRHHQVMIGQVKILHRAAVGDILALAEVEQVDHRAAAAVAAKLRKVVDFAPVDPADIGKEQEIGVGTGHEQVLQRIFLVGLGAAKPLAAAALGAVSGDGSPLDVAVRADRNDHHLFGDQILVVDVADFIAADLGPPLVAVFPLQLEEIGADQGQDVPLVGEDAAILADIGKQVLIFLGELLLLEVDQLPEGHAKDGIGLHRRESVCLFHATFRLKYAKPFVAQGPLKHRRRAFDLHQPLFGLGLRPRGADDADDLVDVDVRQQQALDGMLALPSLGQQELGAAADHRHPVADELLEQPLERQDPRLAVDECQEDDRESVLQRGELVDLVEHDVGVGVALEVHHQADRLIEVAFVADCRDALDAPVGHQRCKALVHPVAGLLIGNLPDDDPIAAALEFLDSRAGADGDRAAAGDVTLANAVAAADHAAGGKVGAGADFQQFVDGDVGVVNNADERVADLAEIVRRDRCGHADGDALRPIHQQIREPRRKDRRLVVLLVVGGNEVHRVHLVVFEQHRRDRRHAGLGVPHGRGGQTGDGAEIALLVDERVAGVPLLRQADQRGIDRLVAMGVIALHRLADDTGAF